MRDEVIEEVRSRADLVEICSEHTGLKRSGKTYRGPCPLHGGEGPNFSVDPARGIFKCFVCGEGGDVFSFVMKLLGLDFPSAVRYVAERAGVEVPEDDERREDPHAALREAVAFAAEWFATRLADLEAGARGRAYLESRGFDAEAAELYRLGYVPDAWRALREAALARGLPTSPPSSRRGSWRPASAPTNRTIASGTGSSSRSRTSGTDRWASAGATSPAATTSPSTSTRRIRPIFSKGRTLFAAQPGPSRDPSSGGRPDRWRATWMSCRSTRRGSRTRWPRWARPSPPNRRSW